jgi:hypothetical protein
MGDTAAGGRSIRLVVHLPLGTMTEGLAGGESVEDESLLPKFYYLDESDPDILVLRRQDGSFVAAFSAQGATREGIVEAAKEDYWKVTEANAESLGLREEGDRQKSAWSGSNVYVIDADGSDRTGLAHNVELVSWSIG